MANRTFSFQDHDDTSYNPPSQPQPYRATPPGYTVSNPAAYLNDITRQRSMSPASSVGSGSPPRNAYRDQSPYRQEEQYERGGYGIPLQDTSQQRARQQQNIPVPPPHSHLGSMPPQGRYTDRSPSRERGAYAGDGHYSSNERDDPFNDPFSTPRHSVVNLAPGAADTSYDAGAMRPGAARLQSNNSANFRNRDDYGGIDPTGIDDDDDDPFTTLQGKKDKRKARAAGIGAGGAAGAGAGAFLANLNPTARDASGHYGAVPGGGLENGKGEGSDWLKRQTSGKKRLKCLVFGLIGLVIVLAIVGGIIGSLVSKHSSSSSSSNESASEPVDSSAPLTKNSAAVKKLMKNANLHKVFPGMDYTPPFTQYPACLNNPPSQNHIILDLVVLSQLTPVIRLYGTDCNVTDMVISAIDTLDLKDSIKVWAGVYLNGNDTTNTRQLNTWWDVLDKRGPDYFEGVIIGNEVVFEGELPEASLIEILGQARTNLTAHGGDGLKIATSGLGSEWNTQLTDAVDVVMSNIHPLFGGVGASEAAAWTYSYWETNDVALTGSKTDQIISEVGWPSAGGNYCTNPQKGTKIPCSSSTAGAVAGISEMNTFMEGWICPALTNGTNYFWFEALDEAWKAIYNTPGMAFEDKWGLMNVNRELKPGLKIPSCDGMEAKLP